MKKMLIALLLIAFFQAGVFVGGMWRATPSAEAVTNKSYLADTAQLKQTQTLIIGNQKELLAAVNTLQSTVKGLNSALMELKAQSAENRTATQRLQDGVKASAAQQNQMLKQLSIQVDKNAEKNFKVMEMIYQILSKKTGK